MIRYLFLFLSLMLFRCSASLGYRELPLDGKNFIVKGTLQSIPKSFQKKSYNWEVRFYNCSNTDFGKQKADSGQYPRLKEDCRDQFSKKVYSSEGTSYQWNVQSPANWTHGFIRLLDTEAIQGKYSPGENPFWFQIEDIKNGILQNDISFQSMENLISDKEQIQLAEKFSPIIVVKKGKKYKPSNLAKFSENYKVEKYTGKNKDSSQYDLEDAVSDEYMILDESLYGTGKTHLYFHVRYAQTFVSGTGNKSLPGWKDNRNYRYEKGNGDKVISFYLWYDYNDGPSSFGNRHEGDFESFAILVDSRGNPKRFMVTGHDHIMLDTSWNNINSYNNHPIIYIAHGRKNADGGNPTSAYGGYETSLEAGNKLFNWMADPKDIFPSIDENSELIIPENLQANDLKNLRIGPGEWISKETTKYVDASPFVTSKIERLVKWEEPGWVGEPSDKDPDRHHDVNKEDSFFMNFRGRIGQHPRSSLNFWKFVQYGRSPVNPPFKMNIEQHFTWQSPREDRCEKVRIGDYCAKFQGDSKTPQVR